MLKTIISYEDNIDACEDWVILGDVTFLKDFGVFKKDQKVKALEVRWDTGEMKGQDEDGNDLDNSQKFTLTPLE